MAFCPGKHYTDVAFASENLRSAAWFSERSTVWGANTGRGSEPSSYSSLLCDLGKFTYPPSVFHCKMGTITPTLQVLKEDQANACSIALLLT